MRPLVALPVLLLLAAGCLAPEDAQAPAPGPAPRGPAGPASAPTISSIALQGPASYANGPATFVLTGFAGAEPNVGALDDGTLFVTAMDLTLRSVDEGFSWAPVTEHFPGLDAVASTWDPMLWVDRAADRVYALHLGPYFSCAWIYWSDDHGDSWTTRPQACLAPTIDHPKLATGPPGPDAPPVAGALHESVALVCSNKLAGTLCSGSYDGGLTWTFESDPFPPGSPPHDPVAGITCNYPTGHPAWSADGVIAVAKANACDALYVSVSADGGLTWTPKRGPPGQGETFDPDLAFAPDGTLYALWQRAADHLPVLARSRDLGDSWDGPWPVAPPGVGTTAFAALEAGSDGKLVAAFLGTRDSTAYPNLAPDGTRWHLFVVAIDDADSDAPAFEATQVTPHADPVQIGCIDIDGSGLPCRNLLDFIDTTVMPDGRVVVAYTEGCTVGCANESSATQEDSRSMEIALAWVEGADV